MTDAERAQAALDLWQEWFREDGYTYWYDDVDKAYRCFFCQELKTKDHTGDCIYVRAKRLVEGGMMDIDTMPASREMDALVADRVFGHPHDWRTCAYCQADFAREGSYQRGNPHIPRYSTDITAAWQIIERMDADDALIELYHGSDDWRIQLWRWPKRHGHTEAYGPSAPHAICRAALKAMEATNE